MLIPFIFCFIVYSTDLPPVHIYQSPQEIIAFPAETYIEPTPALDGSRIQDIQTANQLPEVVESSTGQPLFVNIQPSQIAKVVIPHGSSSALIYGKKMLFPHFPAHLDSFLTNTLLTTANRRCTRAP